MSKYYWWSIVNQILKNYPKTLLREKTPMSTLAVNAIGQALSDTAKERDGKLKCKLIVMAYIDRTHTVEGAAYYVHISRATAFRWSNEFFHKVAQNLGFEN